MTRTLILKLEITGEDEDAYADTSTELIVQDFLFLGIAASVTLAVLSDDGWPPKETDRERTV